VTGDTVRGAPSPSAPGPKQPLRPASLMSSAVFTFGTSITVAVLSLVNVLIVARTLGATGRGQVALLSAIAYLTSQISLFGVEQANVNFAGTQPELRPKLATNSFLFSIVFGGAAICFVAGLVAVFPDVGGGLSTGLLWLSLLSIPILIFETYLLMLVRADYRFALANVGFIVVPIVNVAANGTLAVVGAITVGTAFGTWVAGQALGALIFAWCIQFRSAGFGRADLAVARRMLGFGVKAQGGRIMMLGNYKLDQWLVGAISGARELGIYSVAVAWAEALFYLPTALAAVQRPDLVRASRREAVRQTGVVFRAATLVTLPLAIIMVVAAPILCVTIFGSDFSDSIIQLRVLAAGAFGILALKLLGNALTAQQKPLLETAAIGMAFVVTLALDVALIPANGGLGAAAASSIAYTVGGIAITLLFARQLDARLSDLVPRIDDVAASWRRTKGMMRRRTDVEEPVLAASPLDSLDQNQPT